MALDLFFCYGTMFKHRPVQNCSNNIVYCKLNIFFGFMTRSDNQMCMRKNGVVGSTVAVRAALPMHLLTVKCQQLDSLQEMGPTTEG